MTRTVKFLYFVVLCLGIFYIALAIFTSHNTLVSHVESTKTKVVEPAKIELLDEKTIECILDLDETDDATSMALQFLSSHQYVDVYVGEQLIYSLSSGPSLFGHTTGTGINVVMLPAQTKSVRIVMESVFADARNSGYKFYYGDAVAMYREIIKSTVLDVIMSALIIILGFFMVVYWLFAHKKLEQNASIAYFGIFSIMIGFWSLNETDLMTLLLTNRTVGSLIGYMLLMLLAVPFIQFVRIFFELQDARVCNILCGLSILETLVLTTLHMTDICEFKQSVRLIHLVMVLGLGYMLSAVIGRMRKYGMDRKVKANLIAVIALFISIVVDFFAYYMGLQQTDVLGKIGILVYIILLGTESASDALRKIEDGKKAEFYQTLAITDVMTGLLNRSAFEEWEEECKDFTDIMLVTFDLNNLKWCNDNLGHAAGDTYIVEAAHMILRVFGSIGKCYRIGGDEFCAVIRKGSKVNIEKLLKKLRAEQDSYNQKSDEVKIHIAVGYAIHEEDDDSIEETRSRADVYMYKNKKFIKGIEEN